MCITFTMLTGNKPICMGTGSSCHERNWHTRFIKSHIQLVLLYKSKGKQLSVQFKTLIKQILFRMFIILFIIAPIIGVFFNITNLNSNKTLTDITVATLTLTTLLVITYPICKYIYNKRKDNAPTL